VPFIELLLFPEGQAESKISISHDSSMSVLQLRIGPINHKELASVGLSRMLQQLQNKYHFLGPDCSSASYRNW
jgi:hypothetical protein